MDFLLLFSLLILLLHLVDAFLLLYYRRKWRKIFMVKRWIKTILSLTLILVFGACGHGTNTKDVSLVDFTGMNKNDVETWRTDNNISTDEVKYAYEYNETIPKVSRWMAKILQLHSRMA